MELARTKKELADVKKIMEKKKQEAAAAAAGMSVRTAWVWQRGPLPSEKKRDRYWRTRPDPFAEVWVEEIEPLLRRDTDGIMRATTILEWLEEKYQGRFNQGQIRTLQRRLRDWRAIHGPDREIFFPQEHPPGREAQIDFTHGQELRVTIAGVPFPHLLFEFVLSYSGWRFVDLAKGETLEALVKGLQGSLWELGGVPEVVRSDNLSAATHELKNSRGRVLSERYGAVLDHYDIRATTTNAAPLAWLVAWVFHLKPQAGRTLTFNVSTRNSFVVLPLALALPPGWELAVAAIVLQSLVELSGMIAYLWFLPRRIFPT